MKDHSKSKKTFSWTARSSLLRRLAQALGSIRMWVWASEPPRKPSSLDTLTRNAPSLPTFRSEERSLRVSLSQPKCKGPLLWEEITCTMCPNTTDTRRDTETSPFTAHPLSPLRKETSPWLVNADPSPRPCTSTCWRWSPTRLSEMSGNSSCSSDVYIIWLTPNLYELQSSQFLFTFLSALFNH